MVVWSWGGRRRRTPELQSDDEIKRGVACSELGGKWSAMIDKADSKKCRLLGDDVGGWWELLTSFVRDEVGLLCGGEVGRGMKF